MHLGSTFMVCAEPFIHSSGGAGVGGGFRSLCALMHALMVPSIWHEQALLRAVCGDSTLKAQG